MRDGTSVAVASGMERSHKAANSTGFAPAWSINVMEQFLFTIDIPGRVPNGAEDLELFQHCVSGGGRTHKKRLRRP